MRRSEHLSGHIPSWNTAPQVRKTWTLRDLTAQELGSWVGLSHGRQDLRVLVFLMAEFAHMPTHMPFSYLLWSQNQPEAMPPYFSPSLPTKKPNRTQWSLSEHAQLPDGWGCTDPAAPLLTSASAPQETPGDILSIQPPQSTVSCLLGSSCTNSSFKGPRGALGGSALAGRGVKGMKCNAKMQQRLHPMLGFLAANRAGIAWVHLEGADSCCQTISLCLSHEAPRTQQKTSQ